MGRHSARGRLRRKAVVAAVVHLGVSVAWMAAAAPRVPWLWLLGATIVAAFGLGVFVWRADENAPGAAGEPRARIGPGTLVTLGRMSCLSLLAGYILSPPTPAGLWLVAGLYAAVAGGDWLDGFLARRTGSETRLGERLDMQVDVLGMLVAPVIAVTAGRLPPWYLLLSAAPFVYHADLARRRATGRPCHDGRLRSSIHTRAFAGFQMAIIAVALVPPFEARVVWIVATVFMTPSLVAFARDWCVATGRLVPDTPRYERLRARVLAGARRLAPVPLRVFFAGGAVWAAPAPPAAALSVVCAVATLAGFVPRLAACLWLVVIGLAPTGDRLEAALAAAAAGILLLGGGSGSWYQPEERWLFRRHGGQPDAGPVAVQTTKR